MQPCRRKAPRSRQMSIVIEDLKKIGRTRMRLPIGTFAARLPHTGFRHIPFFGQLARRILLKPCRGKCEGTPLWSVPHPDGAGEWIVCVLRTWAASAHGVRCLHTPRRGHLDAGEQRNALRESFSVTRAVPRPSNAA